jgi:hypothetical protein
VLYLALHLLLPIFLGSAAVSAYTVGRLFYVLYSRNALVILFPCTLLGFVALSYAGWAFFMLAKGSISHVYRWTEDAERKRKDLFEYSTRLKRRLSIEDRSA